MGDESFTQRIFLHSMGNLIFYNALISNKCAINPENTNVYSFGGPFLGTNLIPIASDICAAQKEYQLIKQIPMANNIGEMADIFLRSRSLTYSFLSEKVRDYISRPEVQDRYHRICNPGTGLLTPAFASIGELYPNGSKELLEVAQMYTTGGICGSKIGSDNLLTKYILEFGKSVHGSDEHDGVVHIKSCTAVSPESLWVYKGDDIPDKFWLAPKSHNEIIGRTQDPEILHWLEILD